MSGGPEDAIPAGIAEIFQEVFPRDDLILTPELSAHDMQDWDSFKHIEIILAVEERFGIALTTREMDALASVGDVVRVVEARGGSKPGSGAGA